MMGAMWMGDTELMGDKEPAPRPAWRTMLRSAADVVLPPVCVVCRSPIGIQGLLCGPCFAGIDFIAPPLCARLGVSLPFDAGGSSLSAPAIAAPLVYDRAGAVARYTQTMRDLIQGFKYRDRQEGLRLFSRWLAHAVEPAAFVL